MNYRPKLWVIHGDSQPIRRPAMLKLLQATIMAALVTALIPASAYADPYKWCANYTGDDGGSGNNCGFVTLEQCRAAAAGMGGFCDPNPFYTPPTERPAKRTRKARNN